MDNQIVPFLIKGPSFLEGFPDMAEVESFRQEIFDADALSLFEYWISKCSEEAIPTKNEIDPVDLPKLLNRIYIEEWDAEWQQSRLKLAGDFHHQIYGGNVHGLVVDDHVTSETNKLWKQCDQYNFIQLCPTYCGYHLEHVDKGHIKLADLTLPMRDKDEAVCAIGIVSYL